MTPAQVLELYDREARVRTDGLAPGFRAEWDGPVLRLIGPDRGAASNGVLFASLNASSADEAIARQVAFFGADGRAFEWKHFSHDHPSDLPERLQAAGFAPEQAETFVALDLSRDLPQADAGPIVIRRLEDPSTFGAIADVNRAVYGRPDQAAWLQRVIADEKRADPDSLSVYAAFDGAAPVSVGWMRHRRGDAFGSLWGGSTLASHRGRGIYSALVSLRADEARRRGCRWLTVDCSPMSLPILERRGFDRLAVITPYIWTGA